MSLMQRLFGAAPAQSEDQPFDEAEVAGDDYAGYDGQDAGLLSSSAMSTRPGTIGTLYRAEPRSFEDAGPIANRLKEGHPVVVSLEHTDQAEAQRIRDFLRGAAYVLGGDVRKVASRVYACVPARMDYQKLQSAADQPAAPHLTDEPAPADLADPWRQ